MPVDSKHEQFRENADDWRLLRDATEGEPAIKGLKLSTLADKKEGGAATAAQRYLPKPEGASEAQYSNYVCRAKFLNFTGQTKISMNGRIWRKAPERELPPTLERLNDAGEVIEGITSDITMSGQSLDDFAKEVTGEVLALGRHIVVPSFSREAGRSYLRGYAAERVINWGEEFINGVNKLTFVVLEETFDKGSGDAFDPELETAYHVMGLVSREILSEFGDLRGEQSTEIPLDLQNVPFGKGRDLVLVSGRLVQKGEGQGFQPEPNAPPAVVPKLLGETMDEIPIVFFGPSSLKPDVEKSHLLDLARLNIHHYQRTADHSNFLYRSAYLVPWFTGLSENEKKQILSGELKMGSSGWVFTSKEAKVGQIETTGDALSEHRAAMDDDKDEMHALGAKFSKDEGGSNISEETERLQKSGQGSILRSVANTTSMGMERALEWCARFQGDPNPQVKYRLNTDLLDRIIDPQLLKILSEMEMAGQISAETLHWNMSQGELTEPGLAFEDELGRIGERDPDRTV